MIADTIASMARQVMTKASLSRTQAEWLAELDRAYLLDLFRAASRIRERLVGKRVRCCSIVAAKVGRCGEDCAFCSQSAHYKTPVKEANVLEADDVLKAARDAVANGAESFGIVNSGYAPTNDEIEHWGQVIRRLRSLRTIRVCASFGVVSRDQAFRLAELGAQRYNHNLQTSSRHFPAIVTTHAYDDRLQTLHHLKAAGISLCSGALFGMGETWEDRLDLAFELRAMDPDVVPLNFLTPIAGTPLADAEPLEPLTCLHIIAVYRFLFPRCQIKIAGGREVNLRDLQSWMFLAGADGFLMGNYLTTCGQSPAADRRIVRDLGLEFDTFHEPASPPAPIAEPVYGL